ncbi:MAG: hypothetical protein NZ473_08960 [Candidatus Kapabacteria bacterium]|nr:hypothetical protein [Candidatus Kapabacteria bacterium]
MPKSVQTTSLSVNTSGATFQASTGETRYVVEVTATTEMAVDIGSGTSWIEGFRVGTGWTPFRTPIAVHGGTTKQLRFRTISGTGTAIVTYISQT